jgi:FKBP-type peptidyl-prolyl cis-trans isomerase SlpA
VDTLKTDANGFLKWNIAGQSVIAVGSTIAFNEAWYAGHERTGLHSFDDSGEWLQMDKLGHAVGAYRTAKYLAYSWQWSGLSEQAADNISTLTSIGYLTVIEILDGMMIQGFDEGVLGMELNESKTIDIPFEKAYGAVNPELVRDVENQHLPQGLEPKVGMKLEGKSQNGQNFKVTITEVKDDSVTIDANHELAGKNLIFDVKVVEIANL